MRPGRDTQPSNLCRARLHSFREASYIACCVLRPSPARLLNGRDDSLLAGDDGAHLLRPTSAPKNYVGWSLSHCQRSFPSKVRADGDSVPGQAKPPPRIRQPFFQRRLRIESEHAPGFLDVCVVVADFSGTGRLVAHTEGHFWKDF